MRWAAIEEETHVTPPHPGHRRPDGGNRHAALGQTAPAPADGTRPAPAVEGQSPTARDATAPAATPLAPAQLDPALTQEQPAGEANPPVEASSGEEGSGTVEAAPDTAVPDAAALREETLSWFEVIPLAATPPTDTVMTRAKIDLGAMLFFDPRMSRSGLFSCQSCHNVGMGGVDQLETSIGHGWQAGPRNSPTMFNAVFNAAQFWDGRAEDLAEQAMGPVQAGVEMANTPENLIETLNSMPQYVEAFRESFPDDEDPVTFDNFAEAVEAFETTLITPNAPFDQFLLGVDNALDDSQKRGLQAFMEVGCTTCHAGVNLGGQSYWPFGVVETPPEEILPEGDTGRYMVTNTEGDEYVFRAAPLRNVELTPPYFHSGVVWDLREAVQVMSSAQLGTELTEQQADDITAFLVSLTGEQPLIVHPLLPPRSDTTPRPDPTTLE